MSVKYSSPLMKWSDEEEMFVLAQHMTATWVREGHVAITITVPSGFETDLASIPKRLQSVVGKLGHHILPAIVHDYIYVGGTDLSKKEGDAMFLDGMKSKKVWFGKRWVMWAAVRANFNGGHWG